MDDEKIQLIYTKYKDMLYRTAFSYVKNRAEAEDSVQETYTRLIQNSPTFSGEEHVKAWLLRTTINICKDILKSAWNQKTVQLDSLVEPTTEHLQPPHGIEDDIFDVVTKLPEKYRIPIYLFYYEGYSIREISQFLETPEATIKTHLKRGRDMLKERITT